MILPLDTARRVPMSSASGQDTKRHASFFVSEREEESIGTKRERRRFRPAVTPEDAHRLSRETDLFRSMNSSSCNAPIHEAAASVHTTAGDLQCFQFAADAERQATRDRVVGDRHGRIVSVVSALASFRRLLLSFYDVHTVTVENGHVQETNGGSGKMLGYGVIVALDHRRARCGRRAGALTRWVLRRRAAV